MLKIKTFKYGEDEKALKKSEDEVNAYLYEQKIRRDQIVSVTQDKGVLTIMYRDEPANR